MLLSQRQNMIHSFAGALLEVNGVDDTVWQLVIVMFALGVIFCPFSAKTIHGMPHLVNLKLACLVSNRLNS